MLAYQVVRIWVETSNKKKMPTLRSLLARSDTQTVQEQQSVIAVLAAQFGWKPRVKKKAKRKR